MSLVEAFNMLQALGPARAVDRWGSEGLESPPVIKACSLTLAGLLINPSGDPEVTTTIMAHMLWLVAVAFEAGRIYEGGTPV